MRLMCFCVLLALTGCINIIEPKVECTRQWEGHYYTTNDFHECTKNITLKKGESVWVLSDSTMIRVLKNTKVK